MNKDKFDVEFTLEVDPVLGTDNHDIKLFLEMLNQFILPDKFRIQEVRVSWHTEDDSE